MNQQQFSIPLSNVNTIVRAERNVFATAYIAGLVVNNKSSNSCNVKLPFY